MAQTAGDTQTASTLPYDPAAGQGTTSNLPYDPASGQGTVTNLAGTGTSSANDYQGALLGGALPAGANPFGSIGGAATTVGSGYGPLAPGSGQSPYTFSEHVAGLPVILGAQMGGLFGLPADKAQTIGQVVSQFYDLPYQQQINLETYLWNAGQYVESDGSALQTRPVFGSSDPANVNALVQALQGSYNSNQSASTKGGATTLSSLMAAMIQSGAGAAMRQTAPSPILGGGNTYQNLVTSPTDLYSQLYSTFESTLGRAPSQGELDNFVQVFQSQQASYQQGANVQSETASLAKFGQQEQARNAQIAYERTPAVAGATAVPTGPFHTPAAWASAFLSYAGFKATSSNIAFLMSVINQVGGWQQAQSDHNPLGSALPGAGPSQTTAATGPKGQNAPASYQNWQQGMQQTLDALRNFPNIISVLTQGNAANPAKAQDPNLLADLSKWSNGKIKALPPVSTSERNAADSAAAQATATSPVQSAATTPPPATVVTGTPAPGAPGSLVGGKPVFGPPAAGQPGGLAQTPGQGAPGTTAGGQPVEGPPAPGFPGAANVSPANPTAPETPQTQSAAPATPTTPPYDVTPGQNQYSSADTYVNPTTLTGAAPPSASALAFQQATTGANAVPYQGNQFLNAFGVVANMIASGKVGA
jgi:hypothetical protein